MEEDKRWGVKRHEGSGGNRFFKQGKERETERVDQAKPKIYFRGGFFFWLSWQKQTADTTCGRRSRRRDLAVRARGFSKATGIHTCHGNKRNKNNMKPTCLTVERCPHRVLLEETHGLQVVVGIKGEAMVDSCRLYAIVLRIMISDTNACVCVS